MKVLTSKEFYFIRDNYLKLQVKIKELESQIEEIYDDRDIDDALAVEKIKELEGEVKSKRVLMLLQADRIRELEKEYQDRKEIESLLMSEVHQRDEEVKKLKADLHQQNLDWLIRCKQFRAQDAKEYEIEKREMEAKLEKANSKLILCRACREPGCVLCESVDSLMPSKPEPAEFIIESEQEKLDEAMSLTIQELGEQAESEIDQTRRREGV